MRRACAYRSAKTRDLVLLGAHALLLAGAAELLLAVLLLLALLAADNHAGLLHVSSLHKAMLRLVLLGRINAVVHECEARALATTKSRLHAEDHSGLLRGLHALGLGKVLGEHTLQSLLVGSGEVGVVRVEDHLTPLQHAVGEEFARADGHGSLGRHADTRAGGAGSPC